MIVTGFSFLAQGAGLSSRELLEVRLRLRHGDARARYLRRPAPRSSLLSQFVQSKKLAKMTDDSQYSTASLVELSKLLHTNDWPGDISLLIGSFLGETVLRAELYEFILLGAVSAESTCSTEPRGKPKRQEGQRTSENRGAPRGSPRAGSHRNHGHYKESQAQSLGQREVRASRDEAKTQRLLEQRLVARAPQDES